MVMSEDQVAAMNHYWFPMYDFEGCLSVSEMHKLIGSDEASFWLWFRKKWFFVYTLNSLQIYYETGLYWSYLLNPLDVIFLKRWFRERISCCSFHYIAQAVLELTASCLPLPPKSWGCRCVLPGPVFLWISLASAALASLPVRSLHSWGLLLITPVFYCVPIFNAFPLAFLFFVL